ncbi:MAG: hypothetical protein JXR95_11680 [Deltaproteobacteria bacterium]|nr:hypothetical protein [Deltaproteobacteria bacterium]
MKYLTHFFVITVMFTLSVSSVNASFPPKSMVLIQSAVKKAASNRQVPSSLYCPTYCYHPTNDYARLSSWCKSQYWCKQYSNSYSGYNNYYRSSYSSCPYYCWDTRRDFQRMKQWCYSQSLCASSNTMSPQTLLNRNYSIRNYTWAKVGAEIRFSIQTHGTDYTWKVSGLPRGATFDEDSLTFIWKPKSWDVGRHYMTFTVSDGKTKASKSIMLKIREEWETFFLPGISYTALFPKKQSELGILHGISLKYVFLSWIHRNEKRGPSHGRLYFKLDIMDSTEKDQEGLLYWAFGVDLSFERNPKRPFLVPFFGLEIGGSYSNRLVPSETAEDGYEEIGGIFHMTPTFGVHLWTDRNIFVTLTGGYTFAVGDYERLSGWKVDLGINFTMW